MGHALHITPTRCLTCPRRAVGWYAPTGTYTFSLNGASKLAKTGQDRLALTSPRIECAGFLTISAAYQR